MLTTLLLLSLLPQYPDYDDVPQFVGLQPVAELNTAANDKWPTLTEDELTIVFASDRPGGQGGFDLYMAQRPHVEAPFGTPTLLSQANSAGNDMAPQLSFDGLSLFFSSDRSGGLGARDLYVSTRTSTTAQFGPARNLGAAINGTGLVNDDPFPTQDGRRLFYTTNTSTAKRDILFATQDASGVFGSPVPFVQGNSPDNEMSPQPNLNGQSVYFLSDRQGGPTPLGYWITSYDNVTKLWTTASPVPTLSPSGLSSGGWRGGSTQRFYYDRYVSIAWDIYCICPKSEVVMVDKCIVSTVHRSNCRWKWIPPGWIYDFTYTWHVWIKVPKLVTLWYDWRKQLQQGVGLLFAAPPMPPNFNGLTVPGFEGAFLLDPFRFILLAGPVPHQNGLVRVELPVPNNPAWDGVKIDLQAVGIDSSFKSGSFSKVSQIVFHN